MRLFRWQPEKSCSGLTRAANQIRSPRLRFERMNHARAVVRWRGRNTAHHETETRSARRRAGMVGRDRKARRQVTKPGQGCGKRQERQERRMAERQTAQEIVRNLFLLGQTVPAPCRGNLRSTTVGALATPGVPFSGRIGSHGTGLLCRDAQIQGFSRAREKDTEAGPGIPHLPVQDQI